jgi:GT2 family glycosyltransferase
MESIISVPVVILNWNGWDDTLKCLGSLREDPEVNQVWLVDNGSDRDRSCEASAAYPALRVLRWDKNYGYAGGYNRALKVAAEQGIEFAYLLNNDTIVRPGFLITALQAAMADDRVAVVGSRIISADMPGMEFDRDNYISHPVESTKNQGSKIVNLVGGAGMLVRLRAMREVGYFDERFFCYWEEIEWCLRIRDYGLVCAGCADSEIIHKGQGSDRSGNGSYYLYRNPFLLLERFNNSVKRVESRKHIYAAAVGAEIARRSGRFTEWISIAQGLHDGLIGKFGERPARSATLIPALWLIWLSLKAFVHDKWQTLRNNPPGYGVARWDRSVPPA